MKTYAQTIKSFLFAEIVIYAIVLTISFFVIKNNEKEINLTEEQIKNFISVLCTLHSAFLGFVVSTIAIIATVLEFRKFKLLHLSGHSSKLIASFMGLVWITLACLFLSIIAIVDHPSRAKVHFFLNFVSMLFWLWIFISCMSKFHSLLQSRFSHKE